MVNECCHGNRLKGGFFVCLFVCLMGTDVGVEAPPGLHTEIQTVAILTDRCNGY